MYYLGLIIFVYYFSVICGVISALIVRLTEKIFLPRTTFLKLQLQRGIKEELKSSGITNSNLNINPLLLFEDFIIGLFRGCLVAFASFQILGFFISIQNEKTLIAIFLGYLIITIKNWSKVHRISDEAIIRSGDFLGIILVFLLFSL